MNHLHMFEAAKVASCNADYTGANSVKIGCVIVYKGTILAKGCNSDKTHPMQDLYNKYRFKNNGGKYLPSKVHSEVNALNKIKYLDIDFSKVHLFVYRELKDGQRAMARPCPACMKAIKSFGIRNIWYTTADGYAHEVLDEN